MEVSAIFVDETRQRLLTASVDGPNTKGVWEEVAKGAVERMGEL